MTAEIRRIEVEGLAESEFLRFLPTQGIEQGFLERLLDVLLPPDVERQPVGSVEAVGQPALDDAGFASTRKPVEQGKRRFEHQGVKRIHFFFTSKKNVLVTDAVRIEEFKRAFHRSFRVW